MGEKYYRRALVIWRKVYGDNHTSVATALSNLAGIANRKKDYVEAEALNRQALAIYMEIQGPEHTNTAEARLKLGHILLREKKYREAKHESATGYDVLFRHSLPKGDFFDMAKKDLGEEDSNLSRSSRNGH